MGTRCTMDSFWICWQLRSTTSSSVLMLRDQVLSAAPAVRAPANRMMPDGRSILALTDLATTMSDRCFSACGTQQEISRRLFDLQLRSCKLDKI